MIKSRKEEKKFIISTFLNYDFLSHELNLSNSYCQFFPQALWFSCWSNICLPIPKFFLEILKEIRCRKKLDLSTWLFQLQGKLYMKNILAQLTIMDTVSLTAIYLWLFEHPCKSYLQHEGVKHKNVKQNIKKKNCLTEQISVYFCFGFLAFVFCFYFWAFFLFS